MSNPSRALAAVSAELRSRREAILEAWRQAVTHDPKMTTSATLPRAQLTDHIPILLEAFERLLNPGPEPQEPAVAQQQEAAAAHGLHRWQQGYNLKEVLRELGHLNECMVVELDGYAKTRPHFEHHIMAAARRLWAEFCREEASASVAEYFRLQQMEANGHINDLQQAVDELRALSDERAKLLHEAAHDLRGNLNVVLTATAALNKTEVAEVAHYNFLRILDRNVLSLQHLLDDVLEMARLQAGKDRPRIAPVNVAQLLGELCEDMQEFSRQRGLSLNSSGPSPFLVEGDAIKIRRITQNLIINALKYTRKGSVKVAWAGSATDDPKRWAITVQDTGPGLSGGRSTALTGALQEATDLVPTRGSEDTASAAAASHGSTEPPGLADSGGEGIGLSIVKRLAELLDASVEVRTDPGVGTTFRVLLPRRYGKVDQR